MSVQYHHPWAPAQYRLFRFDGRGSYTGVKLSRSGDGHLTVAALLRRLAREARPGDVCLVGTNAGWPGATGYEFAGGSWATPQWGVWNGHPFGRWFRGATPAQTTYFEPASPAAAP